jgi:putative SOS response-associated peptidase YedK
MCYSAQVYADYRKYERFGGKLDIKAFVQLFWERKANGDLVKIMPKAMADAFMDPRNDGERQVRDAVVDAYRSVSLVLEKEIAEQTERLMKAEAVLASHKPTKKAANDQRVANNKIKAAREKLEELGTMAKGEGFGRIWPGHYCPVLIRDPATGERLIVPMRYRARPIGWTETDEKAKPGCYNARKDSLRHVWKGLFGYQHGIVVASRFFESVNLHDNERRSLVPGERELKVEIGFTPEPHQDMVLACLWRYVEPEGDRPGFYGFAAITRDPPPEVQEAGHDRCIIAIKAENIDPWLDPDPTNLSSSYAILDDPIDAYYQHELVTKRDEDK